MKIVIDIPEDVYTRLFDNGIQDNEIAVDDVCEMARALRLGTPLPKGHGRLIDADRLKIDNPLHLSLDIPYVTEDTVEEIIDHAPTIVKADKRGQQD